jgi:Cation efflux family
VKSAPELRVHRSLTKALKLFEADRLRWLDEATAMQRSPQSTAHSRTGIALTAVPCRCCVPCRKWPAEKWAGYAVVITIFVSACVAAYEALDRLFHPQSLDYLLPLAIAGLIGFLGNEVAARVRLRAGRGLGSSALIADGHHARLDAFVSLGVVASALIVAVGVEIGDPLIGLAITVVIARITWQAFRTIRTDHQD